MRPYCAVSHVELSCEGAGAGAGAGAGGEEAGAGVLEPRSDPDETGVSAHETDVAVVTPLSEGSEGGGELGAHAVTPPLPSRGFRPQDVAALYGFPAGTGAGQTIGIIELGGGYTDADITGYFAAIGVPKPRVRSVSVLGAVSRPSDVNSSTEVLLDIQVAGAVAPGAVLAVYFAPNTFDGFRAAVAAAVRDRVDVISISWGAPEAAWSPQRTMTDFDAVLATAVAAGITVFAAAGDGGSEDGMRSGAHADFPASSPNVVACGGTTLMTNPGKTAITSEVVWLDAPGAGTGGGFSALFRAPAYQTSARTTSSMRGLPDITGNADPDTGYLVLQGNRWYMVGGTSAVSPLYAGLAARLRQLTSSARVPFLNPIMYANPSRMFVDIVTGSNGQFRASTGWDPTSGLGRIAGANLLPWPVPAPTTRVTPAPAEAAPPSGPRRAVRIVRAGTTMSQPSARPGLAARVVAALRARGRVASRR